MSRGPPGPDFFRNRSQIPKTKYLIANLLCSIQLASFTLHFNFKNTYKQSRRRIRRKSFKHFYCKWSKWKTKPLALLFPVLPAVLQGKNAFWQANHIFLSTSLTSVCTRPSWDNTEQTTQLYNNCVGRKHCALYVNSVFDCKRFEIGKWTN